MKFHRREQASCREDNRVNILSRFVVRSSLVALTRLLVFRLRIHPLPRVRGEFFTPSSRKESNNNILDLVLLVAMSATFNPIVGV